MSKRSKFTTGKHEKVAPSASDGDEVTLRPSHAFVVQFRADAALERGFYVGRVEHVVSGQAETFHTLEQLLDFLGRVLMTVQTRSRADS